jgi:molybdopterin converting factor small subunit
MARAPKAAPTVTVHLPASFAKAASSRRRLSVAGNTVGEALSALTARHPGLRPRLRTEAGQLRPFVLVFLNSEDIRSKEGEQTPVCDGDKLDIVPAAEGG